MEHGGEKGCRRTSNQLGNAGSSNAGFVARLVMLGASLAHSGPPQLPQKYTCPSSSRKTVGSSPQLSSGAPSASRNGPVMEAEKATPVPERVSLGRLFMPG